MIEIIDTVTKNCEHIIDTCAEYFGECYGRFCYILSFRSVLQLLLDLLGIQNTKIICINTLISKEWPR